MNECATPVCQHYSYVYRPHRKLNIFSAYLNFLLHFGCYTCLCYMYMYFVVYVVVKILFHSFAGLIPIPGHTVVQPGAPQHSLYPVHSGALIQQGIVQHQTHAGDIVPMIVHGGGRGEFHHHGFVGHPPPPGGPVYRPRPPGPGGNYY